MLLFLVFFRETLEASLICAIIFGYLSTLGRREHFKYIMISILAGIVVSLFGGILIYLTVENYVGSGLQNIIEGISYFLTCGLLTYMTLWVKNNENLNEELHSKLQSNLDRKSVFAFSILVFLTIIREGMESIVFAVPAVLVSNPVITIYGAILGVIAGISFGTTVYLFEKNINWKRLNRVISIFLLLLGASMLVNGIKTFAGLGWLPFGNEPIWNTTSILSENSEFGSLLHSFIGYTDSPTGLQLFFYVVYATTIFALLKFRK